MLTVLLSALLGIGVCLGLGLGDVAGWGWSSFFGVLAFGVSNGVAGYLVQKKVKAQMLRVQIGRAHV